MADGTLAVPASGYHQNRMLQPERGSDTVGIMAAIGDEPLHACGVPDQLIGGLRTQRVARREDQVLGARPLQGRHRMEIFSCRGPRSRIYRSCGASYRITLVPDGHASPVAPTMGAFCIADDRRCG